MEHIVIENSPEKFDKAIHGGLDDMPVLKEGCDMALIVKPGGTVQGSAAIVVTFTVQMPDGSLARAQSVTTVSNMILALHVLVGWRDGGHI